MAGESPVVNGNGEFSRDFTYIDNVIQANLLSMITNNTEAINTVYNVAFGERNTIKDLVELLKKNLIEFDPKIKDIQVIYGPNRVGDIPHSLA
jgi:UDP-N-acetylglucosamine 4-epimerase